MLLCDIGISDDYERKIQRVNEEVTADQVQSMYLFVIALEYSNYSANRFICRLLIGLFILFKLVAKG